MELLQRYREFVRQESLFTVKDKLLLAVSGGVDSVVLCHLSKEAGYDFSLAHCNFQLRGADSDRDERFVQKLAKKYGVEFFVKKFDTQTIAREQKKSIEETARDLRYEWFYSFVNTKTHGYILTAHHADDNIETVLMNFFRGTGIKGLRGILPKQNKIIRPLLFARRKELEEYLNENKLDFVQDQTNKESEFTRNYFRNQFIPLVKKHFPEAEENILSNIDRFKDAELLYRQAIDLHKKKLLELKGNEVHIPLLKLKKSTPLNTIVYEIIREYGFSSQQVQEVIGLLGSESGKYITSAMHRIVKNRNWLIIAPLETREAETIIIDEPVGNLQFATGNLHFETTSNLQLPTSNNIACLEAKQIQFPLILRRWKQGDYFYPLGMKKKKKLARFFIDSKLSKTEKEKVWVLEMDKKILWVIGHRIDERFKVTASTQKVLHITFKKKD